MKLKFENLGVIKSGEIDLSKELIILTGRNNTGKSYVSYLLYGLYRNWDNESKSSFYNLVDSFFESEEKTNYPIIKLQLNLKEHLNTIINEFIKSFEENISKRLHFLFASKQIKPKINLLIKENKLAQIYEKIISLDISMYADIMKKTTLIVKNGIAIYNGEFNEEFPQKEAVNLSKEQIIEILISYIVDEIIFFPNISSQNIYNKFFPAERSSINLFSKDIIQNKAKKLDEISLLSEEERKKIRFKVNFPLPINDYLYFVNNLRDRNNFESEYTHIAEAIEKMIGGTVDLNEFDEMIFKPENSKKQLDLHISSSTVKSLTGIVFYFRYYAMKNDVIFIDEPELNLHPDNQIKLTHILAKAVNSGIKIVISTHSDYIIKEFNNLIMLNSDKTGKITKELNYDKNWVLDKNKVGAYYFPFGNNTFIKELEVSKTGISVESIDNTIDEQDYNSETIYYNLFES